MLIPTEDAPHLRTWLLQKLPEFTTETDTDILADYLLALLSTLQNVTDDERKNIETELADVMETEKIAPLVDEVLRYVEHKSYLPGAPPPPPKGPAARPQQAFDADIHGQKDKKKRTHRDANLDNGTGLVPDGRELKQPRRGGSFQQVGNGMNGPPRGPAIMLDPMAASFDPSFGASFNIAQGPQFPVGPFGQPQGHNARRKPCRDFATKGYCTRGEGCKFSHGSQPMTFSSDAPNFGGGNSQEDQFQEIMKRVMDENKRQMQEIMDAFHKSQRGGGRSGKAGRGGSSRRGRRRASISAEGPVHDRSQSTIVVEGIPNDKLNEESVRDFFAEFGSITELTVKPERRLAVVKYDTWENANAAYKSPKVIFDNRFVRVYWHREGEADGDGRDMDGAVAEEPEIDMEEFMKKQEEAQRRHEKMMQEQAEIEKEREDLEQKHKELINKQRDARQKLYAALAGREGGEAGASSSDALRAQLAALEEEAMLLGLDPEADDASTYSFEGYRGRGRGRGGRGSRGVRGYYGAPRGGRSRGGSYRGRGDIHAAYASYSLDNRPRVVAVSGADFTDTGRDEALRQHLLGVGEFTGIEATPASARITFKDRKTAEKFFYGAALDGGAIPGVEGKLELAWVAGTQQPAPASAAAAVKSEEDAVMVNAPAATPRKPAAADGRESKVDMDYEQAEEGEWGID